MKTDSVEAGNGQETVEFSRLVSVDDLKPGVLERSFSSNAVESRALAQRFGVSAIRSVTADVVLRRKGRSHLILLEGRLKAEVEQACVVTLEPVTERLDERFTLRFTLDPAKAGTESTADAGMEIMVDPEADDPPEAVGPGGVIDVGEAVAQQLSLAINPYPRAQGLAPEGEVFSSANRDDAESNGEETREKSGRVNPFAVLETLKSGKKDAND